MYALNRHKINYSFTSMEAYTPWDRLSFEPTVFERTSMVEGAANRFLWVINLWVRDPIQSAPFARPVFQRQSNLHACKRLKQVWSLGGDYTTIPTCTHRWGLSVGVLAHIDDKLAPSDSYTLCVYCQLLNLSTCWIFDFQLQQLLLRLCLWQYLCKA